MLSPHEHGMDVLFDKHLGEIASLTTFSRISRQHARHYNEDDLWKNLRQSTPTYLRRLEMHAIIDGAAHRMPIRLKTQRIEDSALTYVVKSPDEDSGIVNTLRMRWKLTADWPETLTADHDRPFLIEFASNFQSITVLFSQITVDPPDTGITVLRSSVPPASKIPLPPDEPEPVPDDEVANLPRISQATLQLKRGDPQYASAETAEIEEDATFQAHEQFSRTQPRTLSDTETRLRGMVMRLFDSSEEGPDGKMRLPFSTWMIAIGLSLALGAVHAFAPGHGKTIISASLLGMRAKYRHAVILGLLVTFTHTAVVIVIAAAAVVLKERFAYPMWLQPVGAVIIMLVGLSQIRVGLVRLFSPQKDSRLPTPDSNIPDPAPCSKLQAPSSEPHTHWGFYKHSHAPHPHHDHDHHHGHHEVSMRDLGAIGASGGMVPCPAAVIMLLLSWQLRVPELGLICLVVSSIGFAATLVVIGILAISGARMIENWVEARGGSKHFSMAAIMPIGGGILLMLFGWLLLRI